MTHSLKNLPFYVILILILMMFVKSGANIAKLLTEIKNNPPKATVETCPKKNKSYFKNIVDSEYLYALYRYESMGVTCKK